MMLMAGDVAQQRHDNPSESGANGDVGLRQAMVLGHLGIEPFDHERSAAGTYELGVTAHDSALDRPALDRKRGERAGAARGASIEPGATATVESVEFLALSPSITVEVHFLSDARPWRDDPPRRLGDEPSARTLEPASRGCVTDRGAGTMVRIDDLSPMPFALRQAIFIALQDGDGEFRARFGEAEIEITGDSPEQAIANLKSLIVATYEDLVDAAPEVLDHRRRRQRRVLADLLRYDGAAEV